ncbi:MAG: 50S ribosomal protein L19 [Planctomycetes bacterium]|nr:50S ribosomal protein L19 [Planctomycetota bacterium]
MRILDAIEKDWHRKKPAKFDVGDSVDVHVRIIEGDRERIQIFQGVVIAKRHEGLSETFTVRRIVQGEGVERIFPINSPRVVEVVVKKKGNVRRAKLHYLRDRVGRGTRIEEKLGAMEKEQPAAPAKKAEEPKKDEKPKAEKKPEPAAPAK